MLAPAAAPSNRNTTNYRQLWVLTVVYNGHQHRSEVWVYEGHDLEKGPVCRLELPSVVPPNFHSVWVSA